METFANDDHGYLACVTKHPGGYVIKAASPPRPSYLILHRATCSTISGSLPVGESRTLSLRKFCVEHKAEVMGIARVVAGGELTLRGTCGPA